MEYKQRVKAAFDAVRPKDHVWPATLLASVKVPPPKDGDTWGRWTFQKKNLTLSYEHPSGWWYEVDLEAIPDEHELLDWLFALEGKREDLVSSEALGDFVRAIRDLLPPRSNFIKTKKCRWRNTPAKKENKNVL